MVGDDVAARVDDDAGAHAVDAILRRSGGQQLLRGHARTVRSLWILTTALLTRLTTSTTGVSRMLQSRLTGRTAGTAEPGGGTATVGSWARMAADTKGKVAVARNAANREGCSLMSPRGVQNRGCQLSGTAPEGSGKMPCSTRSPLFAQTPPLAIGKPVTGASLFSFRPPRRPG